MLTLNGSYRLNLDDGEGKTAAMVAKEVGAPEVLAMLEAPDAVRSKPVVKAPSR